MTHADKVRGEFEKYVKEFDKPITLSSIFERDECGYTHPKVESLWRLWQHRQSEIDELVGALEKYGRHISCGKGTWMNGNPDRCDCGLDKALAKHKEVSNG